MRGQVHGWVDGRMGVWTDLHEDGYSHLIMLQVLSVDGVGALESAFSPRRGGTTCHDAHPNTRDGCVYMAGGYI